MRRILANFPLVLLITDTAAVIVALLLAFYIRVVISPGIVVPITWQKFLLIISLLLPLWLILFGLVGLYSKSVYEKRPSELGRIIFVAFMGILLMIGVDFVLGDVIFQARLIAVYGIGLVAICLFASRFLMRRLRLLLFRYGLGVVRLAVVGSGRAMVDTVKSFRDTATSGYQVVAVCGDYKHKNPLPSATKQYQQVEDFIQAMDSLTLDAVVLIGLDQTLVSTKKIIEVCLRNHTEIRLVPSDNDILGPAARLEVFHQVPMLIAYQTPLNGWGRLSKRLFDIVVSLLALILLSPILLASIIAIKLTDPSGSVIFKQKRVTKFGRLVDVYKLRTMQHEYSGDPVRAFTQMGRLDLVAKAKEKNYQITNDPRVTRVGAFLRPKSIDELPQLVNVIKGDISLVGPRAMTPEELESYEQSWPLLLSVKAGITGLAQVNGRNNLSTSEKVRFSLYYAQNWSIWLDISILARTVLKVVRQEGVIT